MTPFRTGFDSQPTCLLDHEGLPPRKATSSHILDAMSICLKRRGLGGHAASTEGAVRIGLCVMFVRQLTNLGTG